MHERTRWGTAAAPPLGPGNRSRRWRQAEALLARGARWIVASTGDARDRDLSALLTAVAVGAPVGRSAAQVIRSVRVAPPDQTWLNDIVVFE